MSLSPENKALIERALDAFARAMWNANKHISTRDLNRLLDAARQEGARGGEPVALREADVAYLVRLVERDLPRSHAGEGTLDRRDREAAEQRAATIKLALYASPAEPSGWRPMESAPRDRTYILARVAPRDGDDRWGYLSGRCFVIRHEERTPSGYDLGWSVFPGFGGVSDDRFEGWLPLPPTSEGGGA